MDRLLPDKGFGDGQDRPDKPGRMHNYKGLQVLSESRSRCWKWYCYVLIIVHDSAL